MNVLSRLKLRTKLALLLGLAALAVLASAATSAALIHGRMISDRVDKLRAVVQSAAGFADSLESEVAAGRLTREQAMATFRDELHRVRFGAEDEYLLAQTMDGIVVIHGGDPAREGKPTASKDARGRSTAELARDVLRSGSGGVIHYAALKPGRKAPQAKVSYVWLFRPWRMVLIAGAWIDDVDAAFDSVLMRLALAGGTVLLLSLGAAWLINRDIAGSIRALRSATGSLAKGDLSIAIPGTGRADEVGEMARAVQVFKDNAAAIERLKADQLATEQRAAEGRKRAMEQLAAEFEAGIGAIVASVAAAAGEMEGSASSMTATAGETSRQSAIIAAASERASGNVQSVAGAAEELACSVTEISRRVTSSSAIAAKAADQAEQTNPIVAGLAEAAQKIGAVTDMISGIANRTNLLALNATIEAARAGEAGKGFAVVAAEVKNLANQTAKATGEINAQIAAMQGATSEAVSAIGAIGATINQLTEIATGIAAAVEEQGAATEEIARNIQHAAGGTAEVFTNIAGVGKIIDEMGAIAAQVLGAAAAMARQSEELRGQAGRFVSAVRCA